MQHAIKDDIDNPHQKAGPFRESVKGNEWMVSGEQQNPYTFV